MGAEEKVSEVPKSAPERPRRLLLVDDSEELRDLMVWTFVDAGYEVASADTGARGLEMALGGEFDCLLLDLRLPDMSGLELLERLRASGSEVPALVLSGYAGCLESSRLKELGVGRVLPKPARLAVLVEEVGRLTNEKEPARS